MLSLSPVCRISRIVIALSRQIAISAPQGMFHVVFLVSLFMYPQFFVIGIDAAMLSFTLVCREQNIVRELPRPVGTFRLPNEVSCGLSRLTVLVLSILYSWYRRFHVVCFTNVFPQEYRERITSPNCHIPPPNVGSLSSVS